MLTLGGTVCLCATSVFDAADSAVRELCVGNKFRCSFSIIIGGDVVVAGSATDRGAVAVAGNTGNQVLVYVSFMTFIFMDGDMGFRIT